MSSFPLPDEPGAPEITGYTVGETVRAQDTKTLTCRSRGGNPLTKVTWYKNGVLVHKPFQKYRNYVVNEYEFKVSFFFFANIDFIDL